VASSSRSYRQLLLGTMLLRVCAECGGQVGAGVNFCPNCEKSKPAKRTMRRLVAILVFFGVVILGGLFPTTSSSAHAGNPVPAPLDIKQVALSEVTLDRSWVKGSLGPQPLASEGYMNTSPLTTHTSSGFNSTDATILVAFVATHPLFLSLPVAISGFTDSAGNTWTLLAGPTMFNGANFPLMGAVYYCNSPVTSVSHTVTVTLSNPASLVLHVYAVTGTDGTSRPIVSAITDPGSGSISTRVTSIPVPAHTLLLSWVKTENGAAAIPGAGWYRDSSATSYLTPAHKSNVDATSYDSSFTLSPANGWLTAIVGLTPAP
jgi:hypothetical protein